MWGMLSPQQTSPFEMYPKYEKIGKGTYGKVYRARTDTIEVAIKKSKRDITPEFPESDLQELTVLNLRGHPNIMKLLQWHIYNNTIHFVMPFYEKTLANTIKDYINQGLMVPRNVIKSWMHDLLSGLDYLHRNGFIHRDICASNMMIQGDHLVICDFSLACYVGHPGPEVVLKTVIHKMWYRGPELQLTGAKSRYDYRTDIWAAACIFLHMFTGAAVFQAHYDIHLRESHVKVFGTQIFDQTSERDLCDKYKMHGEKGAGIQSLTSRTLDDYENEMLSHMFEVDPSKRWYAHQLLRLPYFGATALTGPEMTMAELNRQSLMERQAIWVAQIDRDSHHKKILEKTNTYANFDVAYTAIYLIDAIPNERWQTNSDRFMAAAIKLAERVYTNMETNESTYPAEEKELLSEVGYCLMVPTPAMFIRTYLPQVENELAEILRRICDVLMHVTCFGGILRYGTAIIAASVFKIALQISDMQVVDFDKLTGYSGTILRDCIQDIRQTIYDHHLELRDIWRLKKLTSEEHTKLFLQL